jgi:hypothetical protein
VCCDLDSRLVLCRVGRRGLKATIESRRKLEPEASEATNLAVLTRVDSLLESTSLALVLASTTSAFSLALVGTKIVHRLGPGL